MMTRREALKTAVVATAAVATLSPGTLTHAQAAASQGPGGSLFTLPSLPYAFDALEPHIDAKTMEIHHGKHHAGYVGNLNKALAEAPGLSGKKIEEILRDINQVPEKVRTAVRNNGGGHHNHTLFWQMMKKDGGGEPKGELAKAIEKSFGSFAAFREQFTDAAMKRFGSGWAWLVSDGKTLSIESTPNQDSVLMEGEAKRPILGVDVWEHAYYLKYQNRRADYLSAWFNVVNWDFVAGKHHEKA